MSLWLASSVSLQAQGTKANPAPPPQQKINAAELLAEILGNPPQVPSRMEGVLKIRSADGKQREIPILWTTTLSDEDWRDIYQTPKSSLAPETLVVIHHSNSTNRYDYRKGETLVEAAATNAFLPFATSDFWLGDFGLEFYHWPNPKHIKTEMRKGRPCYVIETRPPVPGSAPYGRVLSWIDTENRGLIRAEAYDAKNQLLKEFEIKDIDKINGRWRIKELMIRNDQTDTRTRLIFNLDFPEEAEIRKKESDSP